MYPGLLSQEDLVQKASLKFYCNVFSPKITFPLCLGKTEVYFPGHGDMHIHIHGTCIYIHRPHIVVYNVVSAIRLSKFKSQVNHSDTLHNTLFSFV